MPSWFKLILWILLFCKKYSNKDVSHTLIYKSRNNLIMYSRAENPEIFPLGSGSSSSFRKADPNQTLYDCMNNLFDLEYFTMVPKMLLKKDISYLKIWNYTLILSNKGTTLDPNPVKKSTESGAG